MSVMDKRGVRTLHALTHLHKPMGATPHHTGTLHLFMDAGKHTDWRPLVFWTSVEDAERTE